MIDAVCSLPHPDGSALCVFPSGHLKPGGETNVFLRADIDRMTYDADGTDLDRYRFCPLTVCQWAKWAYGLSATGGDSRTWSSRSFMRWGTDEREIVPENG
jgi:hypothetical protein